MYRNSSKSFCSFHCYLVYARNNEEGKYTAVKGKSYFNSLVIDFFKDDPWLMHENIDTCWGICNKFLPLLSRRSVGQYCPSFKENVETFGHLRYGSDFQNAIRETLEMIDGSINIDHILVFSDFLQVKSSNTCISCI